MEMTCVLDRDREELASPNQEFFDWSNVAGIEVGRLGWRPRSTSVRLFHDLLLFFCPSEQSHTGKSDLNTAKKDWMVMVFVHSILQGLMGEAPCCLKKSSFIVKQSPGREMFRLKAQLTFPMQTKSSVVDGNNQKNIHSSFWSKEPVQKIRILGNRKHHS